MDTAKDKAIYMKMADGKLMHFKQEKMGLFVHDVRKGLVDFSVTNKLSYKLYSLLQTVSEMKSHFLSDKIKLAEKAKKLCRRIGGPLLRNFSKWLNKGALTHTDVTLIDARRGELIHSKDIVKLRGKATRLGQARGEILVVIEVLRELVNTY